MKAFVLAAGLGTRLKPWTLSHPKALVPVGCVPMLERVITRLRDSGFDRIVVNIHHFGEQIIEFLNAKDFGVKIAVSDEREMLLDTGGGLLHAADLLFDDDEPVLIHNVDILSNAPLETLMRIHRERNSDATLLTSDRDSSRRLVIDGNDRLCGWHNISTDEFRPARFIPGSEMKEVAFSGIHVVSPSLIVQMKADGLTGKFPIMDFYLANTQALDLRVYNDPQLKLIDIGKPDTLAAAQSLFANL